ncbi:MAG: flagellar export protein FliJ [Defluviitaleaceae bacterium]|nr:flagellar export protein FliJ [Defluviitaleaceae bacterium]
MAKFVFRLQSYLGVKEQLEEQKKNEYGEAIRRLEEEKKKKHLLEQELEENVFLFKRTLATSIVPADIRRYNNRIEIVKVWITEQEERIKIATQYVEEKRLELVEAMKERKALETVKERNYEEYLIDEKRAEQSVVDGIVSYKYAEKISG